ncbi:MAG: hypothetical protein ACUVXF_10875 [Desulfobaccales bacterium]
MESRQNILVHQGQLYLPLLLDPDIQEESRLLISQGAGAAGSGPGGPPPVLPGPDTLFVQSVSASSLVAHFPDLFPRAVLKRRRRLREQYSLTAELFGVSLDPTLVTIIFHILPHFLRREGLPRRRRLTEGEILDLIRERVGVPYHFVQKAKEFLNVQPLQAALERLKGAPQEVPPPPEGLMPAAALQAWWEEALTVRILNEERRRLLQKLENREPWGGAQEGRLAVLLYVAEKGHLELDGFGFQRLKGNRGYRLYKHTGPYVLEDYYGRFYLFPDCRVAIHTFGRLRPFVVDHYKHPFLRRHGSGQPICVGPESENLSFSAQNAIRVLEEGINTLLYSYDRRRRRGYHRLDSLPGLMPLVEFEDYRIPRDHPMVVSGQVEIKNRDTC